MLPTDFLINLECGGSLRMRYYDNIKQMQFDLQNPGQGGTTSNITLRDAKYIRNRLDEYINEIELKYPQELIKELEAIVAKWKPR